MGRTKSELHAAQNIMARNIKTYVNHDRDKVIYMTGVHINWRKTG